MVKNSSKTALVTDIRRASFHDGPGVRTTVFFKGCPLRCLWCHNPECISPEKEILFYPEKCIGCGRCSEGCFLGAKVVCGREMTCDELLEKILEDKVYFGENGGVTFSGGEPLMQKDFLSDMLDLCKENGIGRAVETSLIIYDEEIMKKCDLIMADLKIWDSSLHQKYVGAPNEKIKENFQKLNMLNIPIIVRTPIIPEIDQGIPEISEFLKTLKNVTAYELLPYHPLGKAKSDALGLEFTEFSVPDKEFMKGLSNKYAYIQRQT